MRNRRVGALALRDVMDYGEDKNGLRHLAPARIHPTILASIIYGTFLISCRVASRQSWCCRTNI